MPEPLRARLEAFQVVEKVHEERASWFLRLRGKVRELLGPVPTLAFGTAAALVILAVLLVPLWPRIEELTQQTAGLREAQIDEQPPLADMKREEAVPSAPAEHPQEYRYGAPPPVPEMDSRAGKPEAATPAPATRPAAPRSAAVPLASRAGRVSEEKGAAPRQGLEATPPARTKEGLAPSEKKMKRAEVPRKAAIKSEKEHGTGGILYFRPREGRRVLVRVRVVDAQGRDIPWLAAQISGRTEGELRPVLPVLPVPPPPMPLRKRAVQQDRGERADAPAHKEPAESTLAPPYDILIRVETIGQDYRLTGSLKDPRTGATKRSLEQTAVPMSNLEDAVATMIAALAEDRALEPSQK